MSLEKAGIDYMEKTNKDKSSCLSMRKFYEDWTDKSGKGSFIRILKKWDNGNGVSIQYKCLDPSVFTKKIVNKTRTTVMMSGTMKPQKMYRDLIGLDKKETKLKEYQSPFPEKNQLKIIVPSVTTKYTERTPEQYKKIAEKTIEITEEVPGNTAVFFPSYNLMQKIQRHLKEKIDKPIIIQEKNYNLKEKNRTLKKFKDHSESEKGALLTAVSGGSYGEGIDLPGQQLMGVIIVGIPLKEPNLETKSLIKYHDRKYGKGWEYGYIFPAMTKAIQAAGRCIRNKEDKGIIAYLDNRYTWNNYSRCFPEKKNMKITENPREIIKNFWKNNGK
ncbi:MAG: ATP-dependent DNA helicase, partial [archaeon]